MARSIPRQHPATRLEELDLLVEQTVIGGKTRQKHEGQRAGGGASHPIANSALAGNMALLFHYGSFQPHERCPNPSTFRILLAAGRKQSALANTESIQDRDRLGTIAREAFASEGM